MSTTKIATLSKEETLLSKLGGQDALRTAVDHFYDSLVADPKLSPLFVGYNVKMLKRHQYNFMLTAFTSFPEGFDVAELIERKHRALFEKGMNERHFDLVAGHFVQTLQEMGVASKVIDEAVAVIAPLRPIFVKGAVDARARQAFQQFKYMAMVAALAVVSGLGVYAFQVAQHVE